MQINTNYYVLITNNFGCKVYDTINVEILPLQSNFNILQNDTNICVDSSVLYQVNTLGGLPTWQINFGDGISSNNITNGFHTYSNIGNFVIQFNVKDTLGCFATSTKNVHVFDKNNLQFSVSDTIICIGESINIIDKISSNVKTFTYNFNDGTIISDTHNPIHSFANANDYTVTLTGYSDHCPDSTTQKVIKVNSLPIINLGNDLAVCSPFSNPIILKNLLQTSGTYLWSTGSISDTIHVNIPSTYYLTMNNNGCKASDSILIYQDCLDFIPNAFSPNSDNFNNTFDPIQFIRNGLEEYKISIYDRWGEKVFTSTDINSKGWDGEYKNYIQPVGVYMYILECAFKNGKKQIIKGDVTLVQ